MRMLLATRPGYRRKCAYARRCTCFYLPGQYGRRAKRLRRRAARHAERRQREHDLLAAHTR
ncbi:hypothetical protein HEP86_01465 [Streptomyces sp. RPA4-5]|uniref:hypothetical protein n=1 Tax=Streptomyces sp. RPA4-5 TaxID=2721245 RepID=UPI00143E7733|nr:hypothetical protein [Streptomyces sp. RPA4-5]QIY53424.1 hypothetical protein HEP86_01465 [Streptomyces sp. RPA4-5]